jgi:hypothetical protein
MGSVEPEVGAVTEEGGHDRCAAAAVAVAAVLEPTTTGHGAARAAAPRAGGALRAAALEAALVVFGVVLAFAANEWREHRADQARARHAISSILEELRANRDAVASSLEYHMLLLQTIEGARRSGVAPGIESFSRGFIAPASVYRTAWESASTTGAIAGVDFDTLLRLSRVYAQQARYEAQATSLGPLLYGEMYRGGMSAILANYTNLGALVGGLVYRERELLGMYDGALGEPALP